LNLSSLKYTEPSFILERSFNIQLACPLSSADNLD
jgi:hypothetical protein